MSSLDRYKKKGGFLQLLSLIESSEPAKAERFLQLIGQESMAWVDMIQQKRLTMEKIKELPERIISDSFEVLPANVIAVAFWKEAEDQRSSIFFKLSSHLQKKIENAYRDTPEPRPGDIISCQLRLFQSVRQVLTNGAIPKNIIPESLLIPDDIENQLSIQTVSQKLHQSAKESSGPTPSPVTLESKPASFGVDPAIFNSLQSENHELRRRLLTLQEENDRFKAQVADLQQRLNQIKKIVSS